MASANTGFTEYAARGEQVGQTKWTRNIVFGRLGGEENYQELQNVSHSLRVNPRPAYNMAMLSLLLKQIGQARSNIVQLQQHNESAKTSPSIE